MVLKTDDKFIVYVTLQGQRVNFNNVKERLDENIDIYIDPKIYEQEWFLFSPVLPSKTVQAKGGDLKRVFDNLKNRVKEVTGWNE